ncbi:glycerol-3-phosphate acyltransferase PlsY [Pseudochelatococcus lubricantis]|uniref:Glycerol-3-phosphate acyltransferase n=1 Tax=Pseudochelatococcus lubricantis TaxID=1538102 RepID=A0ABX0V2K5_9HYPH|nr:glycerol-3-phosphate 1-O-acyltransferase PlsY [Pseudochelatococcus lubricantis]NIJ58580.1 glycerol-3-phosphate acyltransferase PlsY [Pseudochelatococcus lubricantis]
MEEVLAQFWPQGVLALLFGYVLGSIPFGLLLTRFAGLGDIRQIGSGNIGATNVLRTGNKALAAATLLGDMLKGALAVILVEDFAGRDVALYAALGAFLGHLFPVWLQFRGGKGVATFIGCLVGLAPVAALAFAAIWLITALIYRYSSLAALAASAATPVVLWETGQGKVAVLYCILGALLWYKHRGNIARLATKTEPRIGEKKQG